MIKDQKLKRTLKSVVLVLQDEKTALEAQLSEQGLAYRRHLAAEKQMEESERRRQAALQYGNEARDERRRVEVCVCVFVCVCV